MGWFLPGKARAEAFCCLDRSCFRAMCRAAPNLSFVTGLGQCHGSASPPQTRSSSVLPALPRPAELAGGEGNKTLAGWQDTPPLCRAAAAVRLRISLSFCSELWQGRSLPSSAFLPGSALIRVPCYQLANETQSLWHFPGIPARLLRFWLLQSRLLHSDGASPPLHAASGRLPCRAVPCWAVLCRASLSSGLLMPIDPSTTRDEIELVSVPVAAWWQPAGSPQSSSPLGLIRHAVPLPPTLLLHTLFCRA